MNMRNNLNPSSKTHLAVLAMAGAVLALTGCGKQAFVVTSSVEAQQAPGNFVIPPKVDILLAEDDSGSMFEAYDQVAKQMPGLLGGLESNGWDYHFATIPLTTPVSGITQVMGSRYDSNWGSQWKQPYPAAKPNGPGTIIANFFRTPDQYSDFIGLDRISNSGNGAEQGFEMIRRGLYSGASGTGLFRPDALLVVLVIGNGQDTSQVNYCLRPDGVTVPCMDGSDATSFSYYQSQFQTIRPNPAQVKFYAAVAGVQSSNCLGGRSYIGSRYQRMASALDGASYDICSQPISSVLGSLAQNLHGKKLAYRSRYLFVGQDPDPNSIQVTRYSGGDKSLSSIIPHDALNGWTYEGYLTDVYTIDSPILTNKGSGYAIALHGAAKLIGDDSASVTFKPAGAANSAL